MNEPNSRAEYEKTLRYAEEHRYWAMYTAMREDGYNDSVNWKKLREE